MTLTTRASDCPVCSDPTSTAKQRWRCRNKAHGACKVPPRTTGRKLLSGKERKARRRVSQQRYWQSAKGRAVLHRRRLAALAEDRPVRPKFSLASHGHLEGAATSPPLLSTADVGLSVAAQSDALPAVPASAPVSPRPRRNNAKPFQPCIRCWFKELGCLRTCEECPEEWIPLKHLPECPGDTGSVEETLRKVDALRAMGLGAGRQG